MNITGITPNVNYGTLYTGVSSKNTGQKDSSNFTLNNTGAELIISNKAKELFYLKQMQERKQTMEKVTAITSEKSPFSDGFVDKINGIRNLGIRALDGKTNMPDAVVDEILENVQGCEQNWQLTLEERTIRRENAVKLAEYITQEYFDNEDEANTFLTEIKNLARRDELLEMGYMSRANGDTYKPLDHIHPLTGDISIEAFASVFMGIDCFGHFPRPFTKEEREDFVATVLREFDKYMTADAEGTRKKVMEAYAHLEPEFDEKAKEIEDRINKTKAAFNSLTSGNNLMAEMNQLLKSLNHNWLAKKNDFLLDHFRKPSEQQDMDLRESE